ncbi:Nn.00g092200.m01.CDS01 [Neocucurbitaria sp. VM-36]
MADKDPPPFGYTFSDFFEGTPSTFDNSGQSLLTDMENQSLADFFSSTDPFQLADAQPFPSAAEAKDNAHDYNNWDTFIAPATVHGVTTTIPDHAHLQHGFPNDQSFVQRVMPTAHLGNTHDDLQAASTLFNNSQPSYSTGRSHSFQSLPNSTRNPTMTTTNGTSKASQTPVPMVVTSHGLINEQLATLIPRHSEEGTLDAQLAAQWAASNAQQQHEAEFGSLLHKSNLKRSYTFGTDNSFNNPSGYSPPAGQESEDQVTRRLIRGVIHNEPYLRKVALPDGSGHSPTGHMHLPPALVDEPSDDDQSEAVSSEEDDGDRPAKKRKGSRYRVGKDSPRKGARNGKTRKASLADENNKKRRASAAAQKLQRENLTEEQKRNNHILSEQKRRNLIKRGFDDLHDLVPEIRNGGLSKSSVLTEAANFLEKLIQDNNSFWSIAGGIPVTASG